MASRASFTSLDIVKEIWTHLDLPPSALASLSLPGISEKLPPRPVIPSSFKIGHLAQSSIALSALSATAAHSATSRASSSNNSGSGSSSSRSSESSTPRTTVPLRHALLEFLCERIYTLAGKPPAESWGPVGGLHPTADGHVRIHDNFVHHRHGALALLGLPETCEDRAAVSERTRAWKSVDLETAAVDDKGLAVYALRSFEQWDATPQARFISDLPVSVRRVGVSTSSSASPPPPHSPRRGGSGSSNSEGRCLAGLRVLELSRVIAAPVAGKTLAAHGADVLWVTSAKLPDLPGLDREFARGKRSIRLDLDTDADRAKLLALAGTADVVLQGYRPGSLAARGLDVEALARVNPGIIVANLSAFGPDGPWKDRRGYDSLVQACTGINVAEAAAYAGGEVSRVLPCQALDHGAGFLLAAGVSAAVYHREKDREAGRSVGAYVVDVSLAGVGKYLRSLGQYEGRTGFEGEDWSVIGERGSERRREVEREFFETRDTPFGEMTFLKHSASVEGFEPRWEQMPSPLGSDEAVWIGERERSVM
ncbi:CoA-transferase family III [Xylaria cf. heliscus]|nr:CoA-transferase family III [Xylaria cf. heliscus]